MISYRRRNPADVLRVLSVMYLALRGHQLTEREIQTLALIHVIQQDTNTFPHVHELAQKLGGSEHVIRAYMRPLLEFKYIERVVYGYNVTERGEYVLRGLVTIISRMTNQQKFSRWNRPPHGYRRRAARRGKKLIS